MENMSDWISVVFAIVFIVIGGNWVFKPFNNRVEKGFMQNTINSRSRDPEAHLNLQKSEHNNNKLIVVIVMLVIVLLVILSN